MASFSLARTELRGCRGERQQAWVFLQVKVMFVRQLSLEATDIYFLEGWSFQLVWTEWICLLKQTP
jgi:hypothetical protein